MKQIITIFIFFGIFSVSFAEKNNFFDEAKMLFEKKNMRNQNFCFKETLFTIPKMQSHIFIWRKYLVQKKIKQKKKNI